MNEKAANLLIETILLLVEQNHEQWLKLKVLEKAVESDPQMTSRYRAILDALRLDPGVEANRVSRRERVEALRTALLEDRARPVH